LPNNPKLIDLLSKVNAELKKVKN